MKHYVEIPLTIKFLVDDDANEETLYRGARLWLEAEVARLQAATDTDRWPRTAPGANGHGVTIIVNNINNGRPPNPDSPIELLFERFN